MNLESSFAEVGSEHGLAGLERAFYPLASRLFASDGRLGSTLQTKLVQARIAKPVELYVARSLAIGTFACAIFSIVGAGIGYALSGLRFLGNGGTVPSMVGTGVLFGLVGFGLGFGLVYTHPFSRARARKREIDALLPDTVAYMYALSNGGLDRIEILESVANAEDAYGEVALAFRSIRRETEYFDTDYRTAIRTQARETPSEELEQFLLDFLSTLKNGGAVTNYLERAKDEQFRTARERQERTLQTLELFGQVYLSLSLFPLLILIVLVVMQLLPESSVTGRMLSLTVYGLVPLLGIGFLVLVSTVTSDDPGGGVLRFDRRSRDGRFQDGTCASKGVRRLTPGDGLSSRSGVFDQIQRRERLHRLVEVCSSPHKFFLNHPRTTLVLTVPLAIGIVTTAVLTNAVPRNWAGIIDTPVRSTFIYAYVPLYVVSVPIAFCYELRSRRRNAVLDGLTGDLRTLSSANESGLTLLESLESTSQPASGPLESEFGLVRRKVDYGMRLKAALIELNNRYQIPRLARVIRLLADSQEVSNRITVVLRTAARTSERGDDLARERRSRTRMQVAILGLSFLTVLAVMVVLQTRFVETVSTVSGSGGHATAVGEGTGAAISDRAVDERRISLLFFHAVTLQAVIAGCVCGYVRTGTLSSGLKYVIGFSAVALVTWTVVI